MDFEYLDDDTVTVRDTMAQDRVGIDAKEPGRSRHLTRVAHSLTTTERERQSGHVGSVLWLTDLSGCKSTLAFALEKALFARRARLPSLRP